MRRFDDPYIACPFDEKHRMPKPRLIWHLKRCSAMRMRKQLGLPIFHCKWNYLHIYLEMDSLKEHEQDCESSKAAEDRKLEINKENERLSSTVVVDDWTRKDGTDLLSIDDDDSGFFRSLAPQDLNKTEVLPARNTEMPIELMSTASDIPTPPENTKKEGSPPDSSSKQCKAHELKICHLETHLNSTGSPQHPATFADGEGEISFCQRESMPGLEQSS